MIAPFDFVLKLSAFYFLLTLKIQCDSPEVFRRITERVLLFFLMNFFEKSLSCGFIKATLHFSKLHSLGFF